MIGRHSPAGDEVNPILPVHVLAVPAVPDPVVLSKQSLVPLPDEVLPEMVPPLDVVPL